MPSLDSGALTQRQTGAVRLRRLVWFSVRDTSDDSTYSEGWWTGSVPVTASVIDARSGSTVSRDYGAAPDGILDIGEIPRVADLTAQRIAIRLNAVSAHVQDLLRGYDPRFGEVQVHVADFHPVTGVQLGAARPELLGRIDGLEFDTEAAAVASPAESGVTVWVVTEGRQLLRSSTETRSDQSQRRRSATDGFYRHTAVVADWEIHWGTRGPQKVAAKTVTTPKPSAPRDDAGGGI